MKRSLTDIGLITDLSLQIHRLTDDEVFLDPIA
jgi:hypothetical protein